MRQLVEAVHAGSVVTTAERLLTDPATATSDLELLHRISACNAHIVHGLEEERAELTALLTDAGLTASIEPVRATAQRNELTIRVGDAAAAHRVADVLHPVGFERWEPWSRGARVSFDHYADHLTMGRTDAHTLVVRVSWGTPRHRAGLRRLLRPTQGDWAMVELPRWAWRAYPLARLARLVAERTGLRPRHHGSLGPFLATPEALLSPLLETVGAKEGELVVDLGCGDGRLPVTAAAAFGCRAVGVEASPRLAAMATSRAATAGVTDRVRIITGDARAAEVGEADVVFAFLPTDVLADVLPTTLAKMRPGARFVAHEQNRVPESITPAPTRSLVVAAESALTVAHIWDVS